MFVLIGLILGLGDRKMLMNLKEQMDEYKICLYRFEEDLMSCCNGFESVCLFVSIVRYTDDVVPFRRETSKIKQEFLVYNHP